MSGLGRNPLRIVFAGTPAPAVPSLDLLAAGPHEIAAVVTRPDAPLGRKRVLTPSPVAAHAEELGLPVLRAARLDDEATAAIAALEPDLGVIVAYGGLVRAPLLAVPRLGWINLHFSLLPRWRGAAPVQRALIAGDAVTGAAVFDLVEALDAGDVYAELERPLDGFETAGELLDELSHSGAGLLAGVVDALAEGTAEASPQLGEPTLAPKLTIDDARLDLSRPLAEVDARLRGVTPEPGAFALLAGERFKIHAARPADDVAALPAGRLAAVDGRILVGTADHPLELLVVQPPGKRAMPAADWWRGRAADAEEVLA